MKLIDMIGDNLFIDSKSNQSDHFDYETSQVLNNNLQKLQKAFYDVCDYVNITYERLKPFLSNVSNNR